MFKVSDDKQRRLFDPWSYLGPKRRRDLDQGWPGTFRAHLLEELPVEDMRPHFHAAHGRPTKDIRTVLGVLYLQQALNLTDAETVERLAFDARWHYALDIPEESDEAKHLCPKTLWTMRQILIDHDLDETVFRRTADKLAQVFAVAGDRQRIDSVHIQSNMRRLGRIMLMARTIRRFLINLKRRHPDDYEALGAKIQAGCPSKKDFERAFGRVKPSESARTLQTTADDLYALVNRFKGREPIASMASFKLMQRVLAEQCDVVEAGADQAVKPKTAAAICSGSLQNPSDPDASYDRRKGQGYQVQIMETYRAAEDQDPKRRTLNLITHVEVEKACEYDARALTPAIEATADRGLGPKQVLGDALYGCDDNVEAAKAVGVEVISPTLNGGQAGTIGLEAFEFDENGRITRCPAGHGPDKVKHKAKTDRFRAWFPREVCQACPLADQCPARAGKKKHDDVAYSTKEFRMAVRRAFEKTAAFIQAYRWRAGVEATMSQLDRLTGIKRLRVRGFEAVRYSAKLKAAGLNLFRAAAVRTARRKAEKGLNPAWSGLKSLAIRLTWHIPKWVTAKNKFHPDFNTNDLKQLLLAA